MTTTLASDTFTGTNGAAPAAQWARVLSSPAGIIDIQGNRLRIQPSVGAWNASVPTCRLTSAGSAVNSEARFTVQFTAGQYWPGVGMRTTSATITNGVFSSGYTLQFAVANNTFSVVTPNGASISGDIAQTWVASTIYKVAYQLNGTFIGVKIWPSTSTEPAAWSWSSPTLATVQTAGTFAIMTGAGAPTTAIPTYLDDLVITDVAVAVDKTGWPKVWNGTSWVQHQAKMWNGTAWVPVKMRATVPATTSTMPTATTATIAGRTWTTSYSNDFLTPAALGQIRTVYPDMGYATEGEHDTTNGVKSADKTISVANSVLDVYQHVESSVEYGAFIMPDDYAGHVGVWYSLRMKTTHANGGGDAFKFVALMWPSSGDWAEGEIDWPEQDLNGTPTPASASVPPTTKAGTTDQRQFYPADFFPAPYSYDSDWHTYDLVWVPKTDTTNKGIYCYQDGVLVKKITEDAGNPTAAMRVTLQAETSTSGYVADPADTGHVMIDWVVIRDLNP